MRILFFVFEKKIKNKSSQKGSDGISQEVEPVARAVEHRDGFLHDFGQAAESDADDDCEKQCPFPIAVLSRNVLFPIAPYAKEGEGGIHEGMHHLVESYYGRLDMGENRTRKSCQNQDDDSTQDSRVTISGQLFQA